MALIWKDKKVKKCLLNTAMVDTGKQSKKSNAISKPVWDVSYTLKMGCIDCSDQLQQYVGLSRNTLNGTRSYFFI